MERTYRFTVRAGRLAFRALGIDLHVSGEEHVPRTGPVLLAANHVSYPDFLFIGAAALRSDRWTRFLCRHDIWDVPVVGRGMDNMRHVPVDRAAPAAAYLRARALLREGETVCAFPEAGISYSYTVRPLMRGVAALARETGIPAVPVACWGGQRIWSVGRPVNGKEPRPSLRRGRRVDVRFGPPMPVAAGEDLVAATQRLGAALTQGVEELQLLPEHRPAPGEHAPWYPAHLGGHAPDREEARQYDVLPRSAVQPTWGPGTPGTSGTSDTEQWEEGA